MSRFRYSIGISLGAFVGFIIFKHFDALLASLILSLYVQQIEKDIE